MNFHEIRFPAPLSVGSSGGPERRTEIVTLNNGFEERNSPWAHSRRRYDAGLGVRSLDELSEVLAFFEARHGQLYGFRWKDWTDFKSSVPSGRPDPRDQLIGTGDGNSMVFQLGKHYRSGEQSYFRPVSKPVRGTVQVAVADLELSEADFDCDHSSGKVTLKLEKPPAAGVFVTAGFEFDVPVRFDCDRIHVSLSGFAVGEIPSIPVIEVRV